MHVHYMFIAVKIPRKKYIFGKVTGNFYTTIYIYMSFLALIIRETISNQFHNPASSPMTACPILLNVKSHIIYYMTDSDCEI